MAPRKTALKTSPKELPATKTIDNEHDNRLHAELKTKVRPLVVEREQINRKIQALIKEADLKKQAIVSTAREILGNGKYIKMRRKGTVLEIFVFYMSSRDNQHSFLTRSTARVHFERYDHPGFIAEEISCSHCSDALLFDMVTKEITTKYINDY